MAFLSLKDISSQDFWVVIHRAIDYKRGLFTSDDTLKGKHLGLLFEKFSTRTIVSFQVAIASLGGDAVLLSAKESQLSRGEGVSEMAMVLNGYLDGLVIRTHSDEKLEEFSRIADFPVINALSKMYHPCQALADIMTIREEGFDFEQTKVCFLGDGGSNVAHSLIMSAVHAKFEVIIGSPNEYRPDKNIVRYAESHGVHITASEDIEKAVEQSDVIYTDVWTSMGDESASNKRKKDIQNYQVNKFILSRLKEKAIIMHCMPIHFDQEMTKDVFNSPQSRIIQQSHNKLHTTKALLHYLYS